MQKGEVIITPSESCYGFSCDALNPKAVAKINALKGRKNMPLTVLVSNLSMLDQIIRLDEVSTKLSQAFHPGPLNIIADFKTVDKYAYLSSNGLAFRIPKHQMLVDLINAFGSPMTTTSANRHDCPAIYKIDEIKAMFGDNVCAILDDGNLDESVLPSTVFDARNKKMVRNGPISLDEIKMALD